MRGISLQLVVTAYVSHFQQTVFQLYLAALMISTGLFSYHSDGTISKARHVFKSLGNIIPFAGSGMKLLSSLLKTADKIVLERRMNRLRQMGGFFEVMALSEKLAMRLFEINLPNPLGEGLLGKLLTAADSITAAEGATGFIQGVWQVVEANAGDFISNLLAKPKLTKIEARAEQDANLFLTRLCQEGRPHRHALYLTTQSDALPRPETFVLYWIDADTLGCRLPDGQDIRTLNEAALGQYYATLSDKAQRNSQLITPAEEKAVNTRIAQDHWLPNVSRFTTLLFYAIPLFVVADEIFRETLVRFCIRAAIEVDSITNKNNPYHRKEWCESLTVVMNGYANQLQEPLSKPEKRATFINKMALEYQALDMGAGSALVRRGLFHLKPERNPSQGANKYVSMHAEECTPEVAEQRIKRVISP